MFHLLGDTTGSLDEYGKAVYGVPGPGTYSHPSIFRYGLTAQTDLACASLGHKVHAGIAIHCLAVRPVAPPATACPVAIQGDRPKYGKVQWCDLLQ